MKLVRIVALYSGTVRRAAPIIGYMTGWSDPRVFLAPGTSGGGRKCLTRFFNPERLSSS